MNIKRNSWENPAVFCVFLILLIVLFVYVKFADALLAIDDQELVMTMPRPSSAADLLSDPVPSCVPSPDLLPQPNRPPSNLMHFDLLPRKSGRWQTNTFWNRERCSKCPSTATECCKPLAYVTSFRSYLYKFTFSACHRHGWWGRGVVE